MTGRSLTLSPQESEEDGGETGGDGESRAEGLYAKPLFQRWGGVRRHDPPKRGGCWSLAGNGLNEQETSC